MVLSVSEIISGIRDFIVARQGDPRSWYVGITSDLKKRLFGEHRLLEDSDDWIACHTQDSETARAVEQYFVQILGTDGAPGGGNELSVTVYAFKKNTHTNPARQMSRGVLNAPRFPIRRKSLGTRIVPPRIAVRKKIPSGGHRLINR